MQSAISDLKGIILEFQNGSKKVTEENELLKNKIGDAESFIIELQKNLTEVNSTYTETITILRNRVGELESEKGQIQDKLSQTKVATRQ